MTLTAYVEDVLTLLLLQKATVVELISYSGQKVPRPELSYPVLQFEQP